MITIETLAQKFDKIYDDKKIINYQIVNQNLLNEYQEVIKEKYMVIFNQNRGALIQISKQKYKDNFLRLIFGNNYLKLVDQMKDYCQDLNKIETKQELLQDDSWNFSLKPQLLESEIQRIENKAQQIGLTYSLILLDRRSQTKQYANNREDIQLYELLFGHLELVICSYFEKKKQFRIKEEINRLFRTNSFNMAKRQNLNNQFEEQFKRFKSTINKKQRVNNFMSSNNKDRDSEQVNQILNQIQQGDKKTQNNSDQTQRKNNKYMNNQGLQQMPFFDVRKQYNKEKSFIKPMFLKQTVFQSINNRSPVVSLLVPSKKEQLFKFNKIYGENQEQNKRKRQKIMGQVRQKQQQLYAYEQLMEQQQIKIRAKSMYNNFYQ